jgi:hypothetical protein
MPKTTVRVRKAASDRSASPLFEVLACVSPAFRSSIILLSLLTLGWKVAALEPSSVESTINVREFLARHDFDIREEIVVGGLPVIEATADTCRLKVVETSPDGWTQDIVRYIIGSFERQFFVFRGKVYSDQPTWLTITDHWLTKSLRQLGLERANAPTLAVTATTPCDAERLPWHELSWSFSRQSRHVFVSVYSLSQGTARFVDEDAGMSRSGFFAARL